MTAGPAHDIKITVASVVAHNLYSVLFILIALRVRVVLCSVWEKKSYDISPPSTANGIFRQIRMLGNFFKQM